MYPEALGRVPWNLIDCDCCPLTLFPTHTPHTSTHLKKPIVTPRNKNVKSWNISDETRYPLFLGIRPPSLYSSAMPIPLDLLNLLITSINRSRASVVSSLSHGPHCWRCSYSQRFCTSFKHFFDST